MTSLSSLNRAASLASRIPPAQTVIPGVPAFAGARIASVGRERFAVDADGGDRFRLALLTQTV